MLVDSDNLDWVMDRLQSDHETQSDQITVVVPNDDAIKKLSAERLAQIQGDGQMLNEYVRFVLSHCDVIDDCSDSKWERLSK